MRTIDAPGVEIKEIDKSGYSPAMTGSKVLVMGFANKGEDYIPMEFTSRSAWINYYGEPDNEAERYFYYACMEVINQNGVLYCAKLPYENAARDKYCSFKYKVGKKTIDISSSNDFIVNERLSSFRDTCEFQKDLFKYVNEKYVAATSNSLKNLIKQSYDIIFNENDEYADSGFGGANSDGVPDNNNITNVSDLYDIAVENFFKKEILDDYKFDDDLLSMSINDMLSVTSNTNLKEVLNEYVATLTLNNAMCYELINVNDKDVGKKEEIINEYKSFIANEGKFFQIKDIDNTLDKYCEVEAAGNYPVLIDIKDVDEYRTNEKTVGTNEILIIDKTRQHYGKIPEDNRKGTELEMIGIIPVVTTAANAMFAQSLITINDEDQISAYEPISSIATLQFDSKEKGLNSISSNMISESDVTLQVNSNNPLTAFGQTKINMESLSKDANNYFSAIQYSDGKVDPENLKKIGIVVYKAYLDASNGNKISFEVVEAFCGSLDKNGKNPNTGASTFIDTIVNSQSNYIEVFSNCFNASALRTTYDNEIDFFVMKQSITPCFGFYEDMCVEKIDLSQSIYDGINKVTDKIADINERDIDIIPDAGLANIAQYIQTVYGGTKGEYDPTSEDASVWKCQKPDDVKTWKTVEQKLDNICKNVRKDCIFIADGPRPMVLVGNKKIVRPSKPDNTIDANILPYVKIATGLNTNYGAGYLDWFQKADEFTGQFFWCPPSIMACGVYVYTDVNFNYWDAPAGLNRGVIHSAVDCAFSPTPKQAGSIYTKNWNYAINYPQDGIVLEGQKTFQVKPSAFDRVNVRRLFLRLERATYKVARYFVYEGNTAYTRQRLIDAIDPYFREAKVGGGIYDYKIICDESINDATTIDRNELKVKIGIKPVKTAEFILIDFIALSTGGSFDEM